MKPEYLYHGTRKRIKRNKLIPYRSKDKSQKENSLNAVYATNRKDIALGMALTGDKYTKSFGDYHQKPYRSVFVRGQPKTKFVYVYKISSKTFEEKPKDSHQYISLQPAKVISVNKYLTENLSSYWRKATVKEKEWYYQKK